uniref:Serpin domain-containing protein n=1 Tax=Timema genevievae TaxID=629358 RepID=A0A7R9KAA1_TIMGE|nr:unnamed protein product [Timema genevievae]
MTGRSGFEFRRFEIYLGEDKASLPSRFHQLRTRPPSIHLLMENNTALSGRDHLISLPSQFHQLRTRPPSIHLLMENNTALSGRDQLISLPRMLLLLLMLVALSHQQCLTQDDTKLQTDPKARLTLYAGQQEFSLDMLRVVSTMNKNTNIFFSPSSVYSALLLAYFGAANQTEDSLKKTLHIDAGQDKLSTMQAYRLERFFQAMRAANGSGSYELRSPSRIYLSNNLRLRECMEQLFHDEVVQIDFLGDPENSRLAINEWVEQQTKRIIKNLISEGKVTPSTSLVLVNAAYFKGLWQSQFLAQHTRKEVFFISASEQTLVPMMKQKGTFNHIVSERLGAHVLELPYKGKDVSMFLFLPPFVKNNAVDSLIKQLDHESLAEIIAEDGLFARQVEIMVPKFSIEQELDLTPTEELDLHCSCMPLATSKDCTQVQIYFVSCRETGQMRQAQHLNTELPHIVLTPDLEAAVLTAIQWWIGHGGPGKWPPSSPPDDPPQSPDDIVAQIYLTDMIVDIPMLPRCHLTCEAIHFSSQSKFRTPLVKVYHYCI